MWDLVFWISAVRLRKERRNAIISISLCVLWCWFCERSHHAQMHLHIQPLRARSVCVDSPVCPISCVCFVITVLTVFPWQCACNDTQTHMALGACFKNTRCLTHSRTHSIQIFTHTHTNTHRLVLPLSGHTLMVTHTLCLESGATWHIIRTHTSCFTHLACWCCHPVSE